MEVVADDLVGFWCRAGHVAAYLIVLESVRIVPLMKVYTTYCIINSFMQEAEGGWWIVSELLRHLGEVDAVLR